MSYTLAPWFEQQFFSDLGAPLAGGLLTSYLSQTSTPSPTFRDALGTPNTNPVVLDATGRAVIYLAPLTYKLVLTDALGNPVGPTMDPVTSVGIGTSGLGAIFSFGGQSSAPVTATAYPVGASYATLQPGTAVFAADPGSLPGTYAFQLTGVSIGATVLSVELVNLDLAPDTALATATLSSTTGAVATSGVIAFGTPGLVRNFGLKAKVDTGSAYFWGASLVRLT